MDNYLKKIMNDITDRLLPDLLLGNIDKSKWLRSEATLISRENLLIKIRPLDKGSGLFFGQFLLGQLPLISFEGIDEVRQPPTEQELLDELA